MSSFKGSYSYSVDSKGRVNLPLKLRKYVSPDANDTFIITRGFEKCLFVYPSDEWSRLEQNLRTLSTYNADDRLFLRLLHEWAYESQLDAQARIVIPPELRAYSGIGGEVRVVGVLEKIELWNPKTYEDYKAAQSVTYEDIASKVMKPK
ncbi:MAG: division/cell wall cluster transcriptional repressor MraZ [Bacteroidota bacterium]